MISGIGVSPGIAIATATLFSKQKYVISDSKAQSVADEMAACKKAFLEVAEETENLYQKTLAVMGEDQAKIFVAHRMILEDPDLIENVTATIEHEHHTAAYAIEKCLDAYAVVFESMEDELMRERATDIRDIKNRLLGAVLNKKACDLSCLPGITVIVAQDMTPSDTATMDVKQVAGIVTQNGGRTSHSAIMARSLEIPAVAGVGGALDIIKDGDLLIVDGDSGEIMINPDQAAVALYESKRAKLLEAKELLKAYRDKSTVTTDGRKIELAANIGTPQELSAVLEKGAEGIGLYRSEFLFLDRQTLPTEEEQLAAYKEVLEGMRGKRVIVRTLDIGGDKKLPSLNLSEEENPFLGYRAIRLCLDRTDLFKTQLRALMRASVFGNLSIMFPMISCVEELRQAKAVLNEVKDDLAAESVEFLPDVPVGIMIEIPAAAMISDILAKEADFFSIGTNDLIQYTVAADRGNEKVAHLYSPYHPALLRLVAQTIASARDNGIFCGMCGETAGDPVLAPVWVGMGIDELSVNPGSVLGMRKTINALAYEKCVKKAAKVVTLSSGEEVRAFLDAQ